MIFESSHCTLYTFMHTSHTLTYHGFSPVRLPTYACTKYEYTVKYNI